MRGRDNGVADVEIHVKPQLCWQKRRSHGDAHAAVGVLVTDDRCGSAVRLESNAVIDFDAGDLADDGAGEVGVVAERVGLEIDVAGRASLAEGSKEDASLQNALIAVRGPGESVEERFEDVELEEFRDGPALGPGPLLEIEVGTAGAGVAGGSQSRTSNAARSGASAPLKCWAISRSWPGFRPRRVSHDRSASQASSAPWSWRRRTTSIMDRSAE